MTQPTWPDSSDELDEEIADLERQLAEAKAKYEAEAVKAMEVCDRVLEDMKRKDPELYASILFAELPTDGGGH